MLLPIMDYNDQFYILLTQQYRRTLQTIENRALRIIYKHTEYSVSEMNTNAKSQTLEHRRACRLLTTMFEKRENHALLDDRLLPTRQHGSIVFNLPRPHTEWGRK
jgi:hypothetical protein